MTNFHFVLVVVALYIAGYIFTLILAHGLNVIYLTSSYEQFRRDFRNAAKGSLVWPLYGFIVLVFYFLLGCEWLNDKCKLVERTRRVRVFLDVSARLEKHLQFVYKKRREELRADPMLHGTLRTSK